MILIQGLGCPETGARAVLSAVIAAAPVGRRVLVLCPSQVAAGIAGESVDRSSRGVTVVGLSHRVFGRWLRPVLELLIGILAALRVCTVVNLSNYGMALGGSYCLYLHSPLLLDDAAPSGWSRGRANWIKRAMLGRTLRSAFPVIVQTEAMRSSVEQYCSKRSIATPPTRVLLPLVEARNGPEMQRHYSFQLFYPTSAFPHKRAELAVESARVAHAQDQDVGLVITTAPPEGGVTDSAVVWIGPIPAPDVWNWYRGSDALLFTSERETLGLPLLEALAVGLPVIAPRLPYATAILGDAGCYFDVAVPESVAASIQTCRRSLTEWRALTRARASLVRAMAASWEEHWRHFLEAEAPSELRA